MQSLNGVRPGRQLSPKSIQCPYVHAGHFCSSLAIGVRGGVFTLTFARLNLRLRNHLYRALMRQEIGFFDENHTGETESSRLSAFT